jgi:hypothetical protein
MLPTCAISGTPPAVHRPRARAGGLGRHHPPFPRLLFVLDGTGPTRVETRMNALSAPARQLALSRFPHDVPVLASSPADLLHHGPSATVWRPVREPDQQLTRLRWCRPAVVGIRVHGASVTAGESLEPLFRKDYGAGP